MNYNALGSALAGAAGNWANSQPGMQNQQQQQGMQQGGGMIAPMGTALGSIAKNINQRYNPKPPGVTPGVGNAPMSSADDADNPDGNLTDSTNNGTPTMAMGGLISGTPDWRPPQAEQAMRRYSPIGPRNPAARLQPSPQDMSHRLPNRLAVTPRLNVRLPKPKVPGLGKVGMK